MASILLASADANLRSQLRRLLAMSSRLANESLMEAGSRGEVEASLLAGTLDAAVIDEALAGPTLPVSPRKATPIILLSVTAIDSVTRQNGRTILRSPQ